VHVTVDSSSQPSRFGNRIEVRSSDQTAVILGISTSRPEYRVAQRDLATWFCNYFEYPDRLARFVHRLHARSGIEFRYSVLPDFGHATVPRLFERGRACGIIDRMDVYRAEAPSLAARACRGALEEAEIAAPDVTHLIVVTSTGFMTPGPDIAIARLLGLNASVERTTVSMHGCVGGVVGLALAAQIVRGIPTARVLMVGVELCTIHLGGGTDRQTMVANSLFSDGAAAVVVAPESPRRRGLATLGVRRTMIVPDSSDSLQWNLAPNRFELVLSRNLPAQIEAHVADFVLRFKASDGGREAVCDHSTSISSWSVHPGGAAILRGVQRSLGLAEYDLMSSHEALRLTGNLSSASVLCALDRELRRQPRSRNSTRGLVLGFGPGLCIDGIEYSLGG